MLHPDSLLARMKPDTRSKIAGPREKVSKLIYGLSPDDVVMHAFRQSYTEFVRQKNLSPYSEVRLRALRQNGLLVISNAIAPSGEVLVWHSHVCNGQNCHGVAIGIVVSELASQQ